MFARFSMVAVWWWPGGLLPGLLPAEAAAVPGGGGICMTPGRMGMAGGGKLLWELSWLGPEPFCLWTMLGGALRTLELSGGGKRERGGASGRGGPALGGGGGIPARRYMMDFIYLSLFLFYFFKLQLHQGYNTAEDHRPDDLLWFSQHSIQCHRLSEILVSGAAVTVFIQTEVAKMHRFTKLC